MRNALVSHALAPALVRALALALALVVSAPASAMRFDDATSGSGITFRHASSATQNFLEVTGGGLCWGDVNGDGFDDLFVTNGRYSNATEQARHDPRSALFLNDGDGTFTDASSAWGVDLSLWAQGCTFADYDGDGRPDLLITGYDTLRLLRNTGERFVDVTSQANLSLDGKCGDGVRCFATGSCWGDYDRDGWLDLYVTDYVDWDIEKGGQPSPSFYDGQANVLFRNRGNGTFEDATAAAGVGDDPGPDHSKSFQCSWADYDADGWPDLYIASDTTPDSLYHNRGDGTFENVAAALGVDDARSSMGLAFQDAVGDPGPDILTTHYATELDGFYEHRAGAPFLDRSGEGDLADDQGVVRWGTGFADLDNDGRIDVYAVAGGTATMDDGQAQHAYVWKQRANGTFADATTEAGAPFAERMVARGAALADYDVDGALDVAVVASLNETMRLFRNTGATGHFLEVEAREADGANRFAIGAVVTVTSSLGAVERHTIQAGSSYLSQDSLVVHAGLGNATNATVDVLWPDGLLERWTNVPADERVRVTRGWPDVGRDTLAPRTQFHADAAATRGWYRFPVNLSLVAVDRALGVASGIASTVWSVDEAPVAAYDGARLLSTEGSHHVAARSTDAAGNVEPWRRELVAIDTTPPTTEATVSGTLGEDGWYAEHATVRLEANDTLSGLWATRASVDGAAWSNASEVDLTGGGVHTVEYASEDVAGNVETNRSCAVKVDADSPSVSVRDAPLVLGFGDALIETDASDATSGVRHVAFFLDDETTPRHVDSDGSDGWSWTLTDPGLHVVRVEALDAVGHGAWTSLYVFVAPRLPG